MDCLTSLEAALDRDAFPSSRLEDPPGVDLSPRVQGGMEPFELSALSLLDWLGATAHTGADMSSVFLPPLVEKPEGVYQRGCEPKWHRQVSAVNIHTSTGALAQDMYTYSYYL